MAIHKRGGARKGAGRPKSKTPTIVKRIPQDRIVEVDRLLTMPPFTLDDNIAEILEPATNLSSVKRPLFGSRVPAGFPSPADDYIESALDLNEHLISRPSSTFFARVTGESMLDAGIMEGDIVTVDRSITARHGNIVLGVYNNDMTIKRFYSKNGVVELRPENANNKSFKPIIYREESELTIWGVVTGVVRKF